LARAEPQDKFTMVVGLKETGVMVAVTGDGNNDALALRTADIGFAMGVAGCEVAKDSSDMILLNDDIGSTIHAVMWGRNIYNNIRKFLMFQITASLSCLVIVLVSSATMGKSSLSAP
jgi:P-type Ca2+ transporter type 2B